MLIDAKEGFEGGKIEKDRHIGGFRMINIFFDNPRAKKGNQKLLHPRHQWLLSPSSCVMDATPGDAYSTKPFNTQPATDRARLHADLLSLSPTLFPTPLNLETDENIFYVHKTEALL